MELEAVYRENISASVKKIRMDAGMSQEEFARKLDIVRPTISNWENGKVMPTSEQLIRISTVFNKSLDEIVGTNARHLNWVVPDTSALLNRPRLIQELVDKFDWVIIPDVVIDELNHQKDSRKNGGSNNAWVVMSSIAKLHDGDRLEIAGCSRKGRINDETIINAAIEASQRIQNVKVYVLSNDVYFSNQKRMANVDFINMEKYASMFRDKSSCDPLETSSFFTLVKSGKRDEADKLLTSSRDRVDINQVNAATGYTPLIQAVRNRDSDMVRFLLSLPDLDVDKLDERKYAFPAITHAIQIRSKDMVVQLIEGGSDVNAQSRGVNAGNTPLMVACWEGIPEIAEILIDAGACINQQDSNGFTPMIKCCILDRNGPVKRGKRLDRRDGKLACLGMLLGKADPDIRSREGLTARDYAVKTSDRDFIEQFRRRHDD